MPIIIRGELSDAHRLACVCGHILSKGIQLPGFTASL